VRNNEIKVLIVDDHAIVRMGLSTLLSTEAGIKVVGESDDGASGVRDALRLRPDVVIMDILMPGTDGIQATLEIKKKMPHVKVLILTTSTASDDISRAMSSGADGAIAKSTANAKLLHSKSYKKGTELTLAFGSDIINLATFATGESAIPSVIAAATLAHALNLPTDAIIDGIANYDN